MEGEATPAAPTGRSQKSGVCGGFGAAYDRRVSAYTTERAMDRVAWLATQGLDAVSFWDEATEPLARLVPHDFSPCWWTLDPASLLLTSHFNRQFPEVPPEWLDIYCEEDVNRFEDVARAKRPVATLYEATGGDLRSSRWYRVALEPFGAEHELRAALRTRDGVPWAAVSLYRERGRRDFEAEGLALLVELAPYLAEGTRRGLLIGEASDPEGPDAPGLLVLRDDLTPESMTPGVERWLDELPDGDWEGKRRLPSAVVAVAKRAVRTAGGVDSPGEIALARVLSQTGRWIVLHGAALVSDGAHRAAVIIEPAHPGRIVPLLMAAYGLSEREQEVTRLVLQGASTAEIAERLFLSVHTVQDHLKSVFEKTDVRSRRELVGKVFFAYYEPRLRDNERRVVEGKPLRGGPLPPAASAAD
jgi:DNA-binding CsgD family transcriptional regulator